MHLFLVRSLVHRFEIFSLNLVCVINAAISSNRPSYDASSELVSLAHDLSGRPVRRVYYVAAPLAVITALIPAVMS